jgi:hypothetical protein
VSVDSLLSAVYSTLSIFLRIQVHVPPPFLFYKSEVGPWFEDRDQQNYTLLSVSAGGNVTWSSFNFAAQHHVGNYTSLGMMPFAYLLTIDDFLLTENALQIGWWLSLGVVGVFVGLRLWVRSRRDNSWGKDDWVSHIPIAIFSRFRLVLTGL